MQGDISADVSLQGDSITALLVLLAVCGAHCPSAHPPCCYIDWGCGLSYSWNFDCTFPLPSDYDDLMECDVSFEVFDYDVGSENDFLGAVRFLVADALPHRVVGGWFDLRNEQFEVLPPNEESRGQIHVIFAFGDDKLNPDQRKRMIDGYQTELSFKMMKPKRR